jgi:hypothetical protein
VISIVLDETEREPVVLVVRWDADTIRIPTTRDFAEAQVAYLESDRPEGFISARIEVES